MKELHDAHVRLAYRRDFIKRKWEQRKETRKTPAAQRRVEGFIGWYDYSLEAAHYFSLPVVTPEQAAMLMCQFNPRELAGDWLVTTNDETKPQDHAQLLEQLQAAHAVDPKARTLREWWELGKGWKHHSWIDRYIAFTGRQDAPIDGRSQPTEKTATKIEVVATPESRDRGNYQACIDAGLVMPTELFRPMPRGIGKVAEQLGVTRQTLTESVTKHIERLHDAALKQANGR